MTTSNVQVSSSILNFLFMQLVFNSINASKTNVEDPPDNEAAFYRIEQLGFQVGQRLIERILLNAAPPRITEHLEAVKFLCKEFWTTVFGKGIDNLKTNHRGVFVLHDNTFSWINRFSVDSASPETAKMAVLYLAFPCGLLRGALSNMGISATVTAEIPQFPQAVFQIRTFLNTTS